MNITVEVQSYVDEEVKPEWYVCLIMKLNLTETEILRLFFFIF
jgi:hypothetical protein